MKLLFIINKTSGFYFLYFLLIKLLRIVKNKKWLKLRILFKILEKVILFLFNSISSIYLLNSILFRFSIRSKLIIKTRNISLFKRKAFVKWFFFLFYFILLKFLFY